MNPSRLAVFLVASLATILALSACSFEVPLTEGEVAAKVANAASRALFDGSGSGETRPMAKVGAPVVIPVGGGTITYAPIDDLADGTYASQVDGFAWSATYANVTVTVVNAGVEENYVVNGTLSCECSASIAAGASSSTMILKMGIWSAGFSAAGPSYSGSTGAIDLLSVISIVTTVSGGEASATVTCDIEGVSGGETVSVHATATGSASAL